MLNNLNRLGFLIGFFFALLALILLADYFLSAGGRTGLNLYTALSFGVFGGGMMYFNRKD